MKKGKLLLCFFMVLLLVSCSSIVRITGEKTNKLELGMSKKQLTSILGRKYTISEKRIQNGAEIEVLSYRDTYNKDEVYLFQFANDKLEKWNRELLPKFENNK